jgi:hypothetical protein
MIVRPPFVKNIPLMAVFWFGFLRFLQSRRDNISVENRLASCLVSSPVRDGIDAIKWGKQDLDKFSNSEQVFRPYGTLLI